MSDKSEYYLAGKNCRCSAIDYYDCVCGADWTPTDVHVLRQRIAELEGAIRHALDAIERYPDRQHPMTASEIIFREVVTYERFR
jgi:hypothetical protein